MERLKQEFDRVKHVATDGDLEANQMNPLQWADFKTKHARRVFAIGIVLVVLNICNSNTHLALHSAVALTRYPINMQIDGGIWIVSIVALLGSYVGLQLVDRVGRKVQQVSFNVIVFYRILFLYLLLDFDHRIGRYIIFGINRVLSTYVTFSSV